MNKVEVPPLDTALAVIPSRAVWQMLGISRSTGLRQIRRGRLEGTYLGGKLYVTRRSLDRLVATMLRNEAGSSMVRRRGCLRMASEETALGAERLNAPNPKDDASR